MASEVDSSSAVDVSASGEEVPGAHGSKQHHKSSGRKRGANGKKAPKQSELLKTFGGIKVGDPFSEQKHRKLQALESGMSELLDVHTADELRAVCGALGILGSVEDAARHSCAKDGIMGFLQDYGKGVVMDYIRAKREFQEKAYHEVLSVMWEGVMFEYLRAKGQFSIKTSADPRRAVVKFWLDGSREYTAAFTPCYIERRTRLRDQLSLSEDLQAVIRPIEQNELLVKRVETRLRIENDFRNVLLYLSAVSSLRTMERRARDFMRDEILKLRARRHHEEEEARLIRAQQEEIEQRHITVVESAVQRLTAEEELCESLMLLCGRKTADDTLVRRMALGMLGEKLPRVLKLHDDVNAINNEQAGAVVPPGEELPPDVDKRPAEVLLELLHQRYTRHMGRLASANRRVKEAADKALGERDTLLQELRSETSRADRAEYEAAEWKDKYEAMLDLHAWESGVAQAQIDVTMAMAADAHTLNHVHHTRLQAARRVLLQMLWSGDEQTGSAGGFMSQEPLVRRGAQLLEMLGLVSGPEEVLQLSEQGRMRREEVEQRQRAMLALVREAIAAKSKKKKGGKKGGAGRKLAPRKK